MHIGPQRGMFKVWGHAWERRLHGRIVRCTESEVNALAGPCRIPSYTALAASSIIRPQTAVRESAEAHLCKPALMGAGHQCAVTFLPRYCFGDNFCITSSRLKPAGLCRIGNSLKLDS